MRNRSNLQAGRETVVFISADVARAIAQQVTLIVGRSRGAAGINRRAVALQGVGLCRAAVIGQSRQVWVERCCGGAGLVAGRGKAGRAVRFAEQIVALRREGAARVHSILNGGSVSGDNCVTDGECSAVDDAAGSKSAMVVGNGAARRRDRAAVVNRATGTG